MCSSSWFALLTFLSTNNGIAIVDDVSHGLHILQAGIYTLNLSVDCVKAAPINGNEAIYFNFGTNYLYNANLSGSFGLIHNTGMLSFGSNATSYPGIISCLTNAISGTNPFASRYLDNGGVPVSLHIYNQLVYYYVYNNNTSAGGAAVPMPQGICTTEITFIIDKPTTIYFNIGGNAYLQMGTSYFTLECMSINPIIYLGTLNWYSTSGFPAESSAYSIASESTGQYLVATAGNVGSATGSVGLYKSSNYGANWSLISGTNNRSWFSVASDSTGQYLVAGSLDIYYSHLGGAWTKSTSNTSVGEYWYGIASSSTGQYLAAVGTNTNYSIYTSNDYGVNWTPIYIVGAIFISIASDGTGQYLVAGGYNGYIATSSDYGANWTTRTGAGSNYWNVASDITGKYLYAAAGFNQNTLTSGLIWKSSDYGVNWIISNNISLNWTGITSSSSGQYLAAVTGVGEIYTSSNYGASWSESNPNPSKGWNSIASSSSGQYLAAGPKNVSGTTIYRGIYTS